jgi:hypothetical protein
VAYVTVNEDSFQDDGNDVLLMMMILDGVGVGMMHFESHGSRLWKKQRK